MSAKTKIIVLRMKEIIYTAIFIGLAILLILLFLFMFRPKEKEAQSAGAEAVSRYTPGLYSASIVLGSQNVNVEVAVDKDHINSIALVPLSDAVATMYPLMQPPWTPWPNRSAPPSLWRALNTRPIPSTRPWPS